MVSRPESCELSASHLRDPCSELAVFFSCRRRLRTQKIAPNAKVRKSITPTLTPVMTRPLLDDGGDTTSVVGVEVAMYELRDGEGRPVEVVIGTVGRHEAPSPLEFGPQALSWASSAASRTEGRANAFKQSAEKLKKRLHFRAYLVSLRGLREWALSCQNRKQREERRDSKLCGALVFLHRCFCIYC